MVKVKELKQMAVSDQIEMVVSVTRVVIVFLLAVEETVVVIAVVVVVVVVVAIVVVVALTVVSMVRIATVSDRGGNESCRIGCSDGGEGCYSIGCRDWIIPLYVIVVRVIVTLTVVVG